MRTKTSIALAVCLCLAGCDQSRLAERDSSGSSANVVTDDIREGIENHIEEQSLLGKGYFRLAYQGEELQLELVRVHIEYLSSLGGGRHFACVDMASRDGDVYDVDFFLNGNPGKMTVTETTVHKINGRPLYVWKQNGDKSWRRVAADNAAPELLGVVKGNDEFEFIYKATLPKLSDKARMWIPMPTTDTYQQVEVKSIDAPPWRDILRDGVFGNRVLFLALGPQDGGKTVEMRFLVRRKEKSVYQSHTPDADQFLKPERLVPADERIKGIAEKVVEGKKGNLVRARAIYDHVMDHMRYMKYGAGWGKGDAVYACDVRTGNCSDFHSYFIALCRSVNIPARFAVGTAIPSERNEGGIDGYHCWAEFYTDGRWWPVDVSEGDKCDALSTYYFGHHPANRVELSRGRDIVLEPGPKSGPVNFLAYPLLEIDGKTVNVKVEFSFVRGS